MLSPVILIVVGMIFLSILLIVIGIAAPRPADEVEARLVEYGGRPLTLEEIELAQPFSQRILFPLIQASSQFMARFTPQRSLEATRHKLDLAGNPNNWSATEFLGVRALAALLLTVLTFFLTMLADLEFLQRILFIAGMGLLGFFLPTVWLGSRIRRRQDEIIKTLPDALDLLTISVEAGLPFDGAMQRVADKWDNELSRAFQLGISIAKVLRIQSEQMRIKRRQRAEEKAQQAPIKMLIPMTFLIFPTILIIILGPAALVLKDSPVIQGGM
jgi:tight adherence protein C